MDVSPQSAPASPPGHASSAPFISPSLTGVRGTRGARRVHAYEIKFVMDEAGAQVVEARLSHWLSPDPHTDPSTGSYTIASIYCDTPEWDVYHREGVHGLRKHRLRRYGNSRSVFLERKAGKNTRVRKRRTAVDDGDLARRIEDDNVGPEAAWFTRQVHAAGLRPVCRIRYGRRALFGACEEGPMRVTFDRELRGAVCRAWSFDAAGPEVVLLADVVVCEFKFRTSMPAPMKEVVAALSLEARGVSKYRSCIGAFAAEFGLAAPTGGEDA